jgi:two-component sensor histidine kinase
MALTTGASARIGARSRSNQRDLFGNLRKLPIDTTALNQPVRIATVFRSKERQTMKSKGPTPSFEARLLLREFSHRINNEFASAIGMISIAAARSTNDEAKVALAAVEDRLQNYALVHYALQMPEHTSYVDAAAYLRQLCRAISRSKLESKGIELRLVERAFQMNSERCWRLGLIVSELITNAERHAFRNGGGLIRVELLPSLSFVECRVTDNGTGEANTCPGHGLRIVEALAKSLGSTIDQRFGPHGATAILIFPTEIDAGI